jgi:hypothetical protein
MTPQLKNNEISNLPKIPSTRYENIFNVYTFVKEDKDFYFYNLNNKVQLPVNVDNNYLNTIVLDRTLPWTTLAYRVYGDMNLWFILYIMNKQSSTPSFTANIGESLIYIKPEFISAVLSKLNE